MELKHQTPAQFIARFRARYRTADKEDLARLAYWLHARYTAGDITGAQIRSAFDLNASQATAFLSRVLTLRAHWQAILDARGE